MKLLVILLSSLSLARAFVVHRAFSSAPRLPKVARYGPQTISPDRFQPTALFAEPESSFSLKESDQILLGGAGVLASLIVIYSEYTLKTTGCGLPAGPAGILGAAEGISYLFVVALAGYSVLKKVSTGSGLPAGPGGILGAAEGLSFLSIVVGLAVLAFQIADYGYIPNAVPVEGGMCS